MSNSLSVRLIKKNSQEFIIVKSFFLKVIEPLYGNQFTALKKIEENEDRNCELFYKNDIPIGILVYKTELNNNFKKYHINNTFEIKTLALLNPRVKKNAGKGYGTSLLLKAAKLAVNKGADSLIVSASSKNPEVLSFFAKKGFIIQEIVPDCYVKGSNEYFFIHNNPKLLMKNCLIALSKKINNHLSSRNEFVKVKTVVYNL